MFVQKKYKNILGIIIRTKKNIHACSSAARIPNKTVSVAEDVSSERLCDRHLCHSLWNLSTMTQDLFIKTISSWQ